MTDLELHLAAEVERLRKLVRDAEFYLTRSGLIQNINPTLVARLRAEAR